MLSELKWIGVQCWKSIKSYYTSVAQAHCIPVMAAISDLFTQNLRADRLNSAEPAAVSTLSCCTSLKNNRKDWSQFHFDCSVVIYSVLRYLTDLPSTSLTDYQVQFRTFSWSHKTARRFRLIKIISSKQTKQTQRNRTGANQRQTTKTTVSWSFIYSITKSGLEAHE